jgi:signal transduction histidine kinase
VIPAAVIALICVAAAAFALLTHPSQVELRAVLGGVAVGTVAMLAMAYATARGASRRVDAQVQASRQAVQRGQAELQQMTERVIRGEQIPPLPQPSARAAEDDPFRLLAAELEQSQLYAAHGVLRVADKAVGAGRNDQRVEIFVNLARRMQSLVHREIEMLDDLEAKVEDPDLLKGLFTVDHLATRLRRQSESLAVLGGSSSRRQWTRQVTMHEVLRAAVAEVEQYSRVKVVPPVEGVLRGSAVTDVIHLIAELVENATKFSAPHTTALLRAQHVSAGVAIEVEDRGLGMVQADQQRMNELLSNPGRMDVDELLRDGRIGLYVVAALARRHNIRVRLQNNIYGGTQAVVVLPKALLDLSDRALSGIEQLSGEQDSGPRLALGPNGASAGVDPGLAARSAELAQVARIPHAQQVQQVQQAQPAQSALPTRRPVSGASSSAVAWPAPVPDGVMDGGVGTGPRPPLPRRQAHGGPATQPLDHVAGGRGDAAARAGQPAADQMTGLMADFLRGVSRAEGEESSPRD